MTVKLGATNCAGSQAKERTYAPFLSHAPLVHLLPLPIVTFWELNTGFCSSFASWLLEQCHNPRKNPWDSSCFVQRICIALL